MLILPQTIPDVLLIKPEIKADNRGYFVECYRQSAVQDATGMAINFVQDNESRSYQGVLRGLHYQIPPFAQSKLIRVTEGEILDVAVDIRHGSPTFGQSVVNVLSAANKYQVFVPKGFAHGFLVLSDVATVTYKVDCYYSPAHERGIACTDSALAINWLISDDKLLLSDKDKLQPLLANIDSGFLYTQHLYD